MTSHLLAFLLSAATTTTVLAQENTLQVDLAGIQHDRGSIRVGLYSDPKTFRKEAQAVAIPVLASGGVADIGDIHALRPHVANGIEGVITGRALYDGRLDLAEAIAAGAA